MTKFYKLLDCENYNTINQQIKTYVWSLGIIETTDQFWNTLNTIEFLKSAPLFFEWLTQLNLKLHSVALTVGKDPSCCGIHTDTPPAVNKLSWPIENTRETFNRWFQACVSNPQTVVNQLGGKTYVDATEFVEIGRMELLYPCIINAGIPHDVWVNEQACFPRLGLQCMLFNEPEL